jgi:polyhydroxyalkanoate synthesis regulator phasin
MTEINETHSPDDVTYNRWTEMVQRTLRAGVGAAALARDDPEGFIYGLVQCGKISRDTGQELVRDLARRATPDIYLARSLVSVPTDGLGHAIEKQQHIKG